MIDLSIVVVTFNHEAYIQKALQSIVDQKLDYRYEVIVADDASQDQTLSIAKDFSSSYPGLFVIHQNASNKGILGNVQSIIPLVKGKYFALLDGDDYWEYEEKLQRQIEFLEQNPAYNGVFHDARITVQDQFSEQVLFSKKYLYSQSYHYNEVIFPSDLVKRLIIPTSSAVFRTNMELLQQLDLLKDDFSVAWKLSCLLIKESRFYYINHPWSVYRNHKNGISKTSKIQFHTSHIAFLKKLLKDEFYKEYKYDLYTAITNECSIILNVKNEVSFKIKKQYFRKYVYYEMCKILKYRFKIFHTKTLKE